MSEAIILTNYITKETQIVDQIVNRYVNVTYKLQTELVTSNKTWTVPNHAGNIYVRIFGGGGGGSNKYLTRTTTQNYYSKAGGGGGWMNNGELNLGNGQSIKITIGSGGSFGNNTGAGSGGTTSFGSYLSANGGGGATASGVCVGGNGGSGGGGMYGGGGIGYQFGGGGSYQRRTFEDDVWSMATRCAIGSGNGGMYGGGGGHVIYSQYPSGYFEYRIKSGHGGTYGGGGALSMQISLDLRDDTKNGNICAGNGGRYGGGGGFCWISQSYRDSNGSNLYGRGGVYGGDGGYFTAFVNHDTYLHSNANDGTNTSRWTNVYNDGNNYFRGFGKAGTGVAAGGGGYGGNGGISQEPNYRKPGTAYEDRQNDANHGGGGGGYGGSGGNYAGGGGGGYGGNGGSNGGGGGGYGASGGNMGGGGGGYYCNGGDSGGGGGGYSTGSSGICIIQYYVKDE